MWFHRCPWIRKLLLAHWQNPSWRKTNKHVLSPQPLFPDALHSNAKQALNFYLLPFTELVVDSLKLQSQSMTLLSNVCCCYFPFFFQHWRIESLTVHYRFCCWDPANFSLPILFLEEKTKKTQCLNFMRAETHICSVTWDAFSPPRPPVGQKIHKIHQPYSR